MVNVLATVQYSEWEDHFGVSTFSPFRRSGAKRHPDYTGVRYDGATWLFRITKHVFAYYNGRAEIVGVFFPFRLNSHGKKIASKKSFRETTWNGETTTNREYVISIRQNVSKEESNRSLKKRSCLYKLFAPK